MGLEISVGNPGLGDDEGEQRWQRLFEKLAEALAAEGVHWNPPDTPGLPPGARPHVSSFPYSCLRYLLRAYALKYEGQPVTPVVNGDVKSADRFIEDATAVLGSHLLCHSMVAGYYVPAPMANPVFLPPESGVAGDGMVGSSQGLLDELRWIAPDIGVRLEPDGSLSDAEATRLYNNDGDPYATEQMVWLTLHEACLVSIANGDPIVFH